MSLFDAIERQETQEKADAGVCPHTFETAAERSWPGFLNDLRMVWICDTCKQMRGRCVGIQRA